MGLVSIDENILADIMNALREANQTEQPFNIKHAADAVYSIDTPEDWDWVRDDGKTYLFMQMWNPDYLTVNLQAQITGNVDWGDMGDTETFADSSITTHSHTYECYGNYVITIDGTVALNNSANFLSNSDPRVQRYLTKLEIGKNVSFGNNIKGFPDLDKIWFSRWAPNLSGNYTNARIYYWYFNGQTISISGNGVGWGSNPALIVEGEHTFKCENGVIHPFNNSKTTIFTPVNVLIHRNAGGGLWFCNGGSLSEIMNLQVIRGSNGGSLPSYLQGTYYYFSLGDQINQNTESTSTWTIASGGELHCRMTTPPTINSNTITVNAGGKIYVPVGYLETYQTATNWSALADYMEEEYE